MENLTQVSFHQSPFFSFGSRLLLCCLLPSHPSYMPAPPNFFLIPAMVCALRLYAFVHAIPSIQSVQVICLFGKPS